MSKDAEDVVMEEDSQEDHEEDQDDDEKDEEEENGKHKKLKGSVKPELSYHAATNIRKINARLKEGTGTNVKSSELVNNLFAQMINISLKKLIEAAEQNCRRSGQVTVSIPDVIFACRMIYPREEWARIETKIRTNALKYQESYNDVKESESVEGKA